MNKYIKTTIILLLFIFGNIFAQTPGTVIWEFQASGEINSSPAIDDNGIIYFGSSDSSMYAVYPDGTQKWKYKTEGIIYSSPAIGNDGTIYFGSYDSCFYALNPDGTLNWKYETKGKVKSSPAISEDGTIYFGSYDSCFYAINNDGTLKWKYKTGGIIEPSPAIGNDGSIYIGSDDNVFYSFSKDGIVNWKLQTNYSVYGSNGFASASIGYNGTIYVSSKSEDKLYILNKDGSIKYKTNRIENNLCTVIDLYENFYSQVLTDVYYFNNQVSLNKSGGPYDYLLAHNNKSELKWAHFSSENSYPIIADEETILRGDFHYLKSIDTENNLNWSSNYIPIDYYYYQILGKIALNKNGTLYYSIEKQLFALTTNNKGLSKSSWPCFRQNSKNTGSIENYPYALVSENNIKLDSSGTISLDATPSYDPNGEQLTYLWKIKKQPEGSSVILTDSTSAEIQVNIPKNRGEYIFLLEVKNEKDKTATTVIKVNNLIKWEFSINSRIESSPAIGYDGTIYFGSYDSCFYAINNDGTKKWEFKTEGWIKSSPAIGNDGTIYIGSNDNNLYAINPDGTKKWEFQTGNWIKSSLGIGNDGTIYIGSNNSNLSAINPDGTKKWEYQTGSYIYSSPAIGKDGTIYIGSYDNNLYAINPDGTKKWEFNTGSRIESSPAIGNDGTIYIGSNDNNLYAINPDGTKKWEFQTGNWIKSSPAIGNDGTIFIGVSDNLYAINPDGTEKWKFQTGSYIYSSPAIGKDGTIYFGSSYLFAINQNGTIKWEFYVGYSINSSPAIGNDGTIYFGSDDHKLYAINPDGIKKWNFNTGDNISSSPAIGKDGTIYVGSDDSYFYAIITESTGLADSPWPKFGGNQYNSGMSHYIVPGFSADTLSGKFPLTVHFSDASFGNIFNWHWDFGDGQTSIEKNPVHTYAYPDSFTVTLIISNPSKTDTLTKENYIISLNATGIADNSELPKEFKLYENYPNPFNPTTKIKYTIPQNEKGEKLNVKIIVYDILGKEITTLVNENKSPGNYDLEFNASYLSSGIYFYKIQAGKFIETKKMVLVK